VIVILKKDQVAEQGPFTYMILTITTFSDEKVKGVQSN